MKKSSLKKVCCLSQFLFSSDIYQRPEFDLEQNLPDELELLPSSSWLDQQHQTSQQNQVQQQNIFIGQQPTTIAVSQNKVSILNGETPVQQSQLIQVNN